MQKDIQTITVDFPWKDHAEGVAVYNNSGEYSNPETPKNQLQHMNPDIQPPVLHIDKSGSALGGQNGGNSVEIPQTIRPQQSYNDGIEESGEMTGNHMVSSTTKNNSRTDDTSSDTLKSPEEGVHHDTENNPINKRKRVSGTKRAAQNRSAQKAFRERREKYVKDLEATALQMVEMQKTIDQLRQENADLRGYTLALQNRLMELNPSDTSHIP